MKTAKKGLSVFLCVLMLSGMAAFSAFAETVTPDSAPASDPFYNNLSFVQVYGSAKPSGNYTVVLEAKYNNSGFSGEKFTVTKIEALNAADVEIFANAVDGKYIGFVAENLSEKTLTNFRITFELEYKLSGTGTLVSAVNTVLFTAKAPLDKSGLETEYATANKLFGMRYEKDSFAALTAAKTAAKAFLDDVTKQDYKEYTDTLEALQGAYDGVTYANPEGSAMDTILKLIEMFIGLISSAFGLDVGGLGLF